MYYLFLRSRELKTIAVWHRMAHLGKSLEPTVLKPRKIMICFIHYSIKFTQVIYTNYNKEQKGNTRLLPRIKLCDSMFIAMTIFTPRSLFRFFVCFIPFLCLLPLKFCLKYLISFFLKMKYFI